VALPSTFRRTILQHPHLASYVKLFKIDSEYPWNELVARWRYRSDGDERFEPSVEDARLFMRAARRICPHDEHSWVHALSRGDIEAEIALLLAHLPRLEVIDLPQFLYHGLQRSFQFIGARSLAGEACGLANLRLFSLAGSGARKNFADRPTLTTLLPSHSTNCRPFFDSQSLRASRELFVLPNACVWPVGLIHKALRPSLD